MFATLPPILQSHPRLRTVDGEVRNAGWLELFFDLVFVLAVAQAAEYLHDHLSVGGFISFVGLFVCVWWTWVGFSFYADQFDPDDVIYRLIMFAASLLSIMLAVNIQGALGGGMIGFVLSYASLQLLLTALYWWGRRDKNARSFSTQFAIGFAIAALVWIVSLWIPTPFRYLFWTLALLIEIFTPVIVNFSFKSRPNYASHIPDYVSHIPERLGIFTLIVLGESIFQVGTGLVGAHWQAFSVASAIGSFVIAVCLWWLYFQHIDMKVIHRAIAGGKRELALSYIWSYTHIIIYVGLTMTSVGIALAIVQAPGTLTLPARLLLCGGVAAVFLAITFINYISPTSLSRRELITRLAIAGFMMLLLIPVRWLDTLADVLLLVALLVATIAFETLRSMRVGKSSVA